MSASLSAPDEKETSRRITFHDVLEIINLPSALVHFVQSRYLDEPSNIVRDELIMNDPFRELVPLFYVSEHLSVCVIFSTRKLALQMEIGMKKDSPAVN